MSTLEDRFEQAVKDGVFPGAVLLAKSKNGKLDYAKSFGNRSLAADSKPLGLNSVLTLASMTKLLTSIAAMQVVEKGLISLEDDVSSIVPEIGKQPILEGFDSSGAPITAQRKNALKLVHLLTHSSGTTYEMMDLAIHEYRKVTGQPPDRATLENKSGYPLKFEPGSDFTYGTGVDWAGRVIERLTGENLQTYMQKNLFDPLGIKRIAFSPYLTPEMTADLAQLTEREDSSGRVVEYTKPWITDDDKDCFGGHGGYADMQDFFKIMESLLNDDEVLLKKESTAQTFRPHLTPDAKTGQKVNFGIVRAAGLFVGEFPDTVEYDWGIGGVLVDGDDTTTYRKKDTMVWGGGANCYWFIDREAGVCGILGTQVVPQGDKKVGEMISLFEKTMYERAGVV